MSKRKSSNKLDRPLPMTLEDHVKCANRIYIVSQEHYLLVADFHKKKCEEGRGKKQFKPRSKADDAIYADKIFYGKNILTGFDTFPSLFQSDMEELMFRDHNGQEQCKTSVYYNVGERINDAKIKKEFQPLSDEKMLTENDKLIIRNYNDKYLELMNYCMEMLNGYRDNKKKRRWIKSMKRCVDL
jgi:hypothetical protein